jgi:signal transduction histidine kinase
MAHELRTPLNTVIPMSGQLKKYVKDQRGQLLLKTIINSSIHLANVMEDTLDMSRVANDKFKMNLAYCNIRDVLKEVEDIMDF